ncbi:DNA-damage inducible protein DDI1-like protein [Trypanosoma grayi]|uniref:DNA-damage inducible protein DDI1-like protein n=1 Tax=Trypanosoma grayi TaxID=71804 RepID=UPI0004F44455|nr:DNA-damage inducible protein DDI1-like protein [Trypanosoma grayi]KEG10219.1 DNA-damage inducible protein DDI1-like protein [Trypanosoma grayi]
MEATDLVEDLQVMIEVELGIPVGQQQLVAANGMLLRSNETLASQGIVSDTSVTVRCRAEQSQPQLQQPPPPQQQQQQQPQLQQPPPPQQQQQQHQQQGGGHIPLDQARALIRNLFTSRSARPQQEPHGLPLNESDPDFQRRLYEAIQRRNVDENFANALEFTPEVFAQVTMLYVDCEINKEKVKAFVDCGAQVSLMNVRTAERCGLMRLLDPRMKGLMRGVGEQVSLGRIHMALVNLGGLHIPISLCVLENQSMDFIIGLDQMKRHHMIIDLKENCLRVGTTAITFLSEAELPAFARLGAGESDCEHEKVEEGSSSYNEVTATREPQLTAAPSGAAEVSAPTAVNTSSGSDAGADREAAIGALMSLTGIDRERAILVLEAAGWDANVAVSLLFNE